MPRATLAPHDVEHRGVVIEAHAAKGLFPAGVEVEPIGHR
jgi:hypothetical protein